jgi:hypothetical protein
MRVCKPDRSTGPRGWRLLAVGLAVVCATVAVPGATDSASAATRDQSERIPLEYTGTVQWVDVPPWATTVLVTLIGGSGGSTCVAGGRGSVMTGFFSAPLGQSLGIAVGGNGHSYVGGGSGSGVGGWSSWVQSGGDASLVRKGLKVASGGGASVVKIGANGPFTMIAAGGGGAGACNVVGSTTTAGGVGGSASNGAPGSPASDGAGGRGGVMGGQGNDPQGAAGNGGGAGGGGGPGSGGSGGGSAGGQGQISSNGRAWAGDGGGGAGTSWAGASVQGVVQSIAIAEGNGSASITFFGTGAAH